VKRGSSSATPPLSPAPILFFPLAFLPPIDLYTSLAAFFLSPGVIDPAAASCSAHLAAFPLPSPACECRPEGVVAPEVCRLLISTLKGSISGSAFGSERLSVWWNLDFQLTFDSDFVHTSVFEVGMRGVGKADSRGVLSYGSKNSVPSSSCRLLPPFLLVGMSGMSRARFWRYHTGMSAWLTRESASLPWLMVLDFFHRLQTLSQRARDLISNSSSTRTARTVGSFVSCLSALLFSDRLRCTHRINSILSVR
jgi:hypothetical protein